MQIIKNASEGQFILKDIVYNITDAFLSAYYRDGELIFFPGVEAEAADGCVEYEMSTVYLYHNTGFNTHAADFIELKGKKFIWESEYNAEGEDAGCLYVQEHEDVREGVVEILSAENGRITIKWSGRADVGWDEKYGGRVPFETVFTVKIPEKISEL